MDAVTNIQDLDSKVLKFNNVVNFALDHVAQLKIKRVKRTCQPPWFNDKILEVIKIREAAKQKGYIREYKFWRNKVSSLISSEKQNYYKSLLKDSGRSCSQIWKTFNEIITCRKKVKVSVPSLILGNEQIHNKDIIVNSFNDYFISVASVARSTLPNCEYKVTKEFMQFVNSKEILPNSFSISLITRCEVDKWLSTLKTKKATGNDGISASLLRPVSPAIIDALCEIVNISVSTGKFPQAWKMAVVKPLHKGAAANVVNNYRPISILCVASKLLESHVRNCLFKYISDKDILSSNQSGFRKGHSCHTCLTNMVESWYSAMNDGSIIGSLELDFSKAFDILDINILLRKLELYGCDPTSLRWFRSYLLARSQYVKINDYMSHPGTLCYGVPQGSILGPLLFILYTNDMSLYIKHSCMDSYADDSNISAYSKCLKNLIFIYRMI